MQNKTFVLIHGTCHGGWCWQKLMFILHGDGHSVFTPSLTGMGERRHLLNENLTAQVHIDDIVNLIRFEELDEVILVGHSYAGLLLPAINEVIPHKIERLVFLDAFIPESGKACSEIINKQDWDRWELDAQKFGHGWMVTPTDKHFDSWGVDEPEVRALLWKKTTPFSHNFLKTPIYFSEKFDQVDKCYIRCTKPCYLTDLMKPFYHKAKKAGWQTFTIDTGHDPMLTKPEELAALLLT